VGAGGKLHGLRGRDDLRGRLSGRERLGVADTIQFFLDGLPGLFVLAGSDLGQGFDRGFFAGFAIRLALGGFLARLLVGGLLFSDLRGREGNLLGDFAGEDELAIEVEAGFHGAAETELIASRGEVICSFEAQEIGATALHSEAGGGEAGRDGSDAEVRSGPGDGGFVVGRRLAFGKCGVFEDLRAEEIGLVLLALE
jgi:hypothetical protein